MLSASSILVWIALFQARYRQVVFFIWLLLPFELSL